MNDIRDQVIKTIAAIPGINPGVELDASDTVLDMSFEQLKLDSLDLVNIVYAIEEEFDIAVEDEDVFKIQTLRDVVDGVEKMLAEKNPRPAGNAAAS